MTEPSDRPSQHGGGWIHIIGDAHGSARPAPPVAPSSSLLRLAPERHHAVARAQLRVLHLSPEHRQALRDRDMTDEEITRRQYRTLPNAGRAGIVRQLREVFNDDELLRVPGIAVRDRGRGPYLTILGRPGLLIPILDVAQRIIAWQVRPDAPQAGCKYMWVSSPGGPSPGARVHVARPLELRDERIWIVEGALKANIVSDRLGAIVVAIPGATITRDVPGVIRDLVAERQGFEEAA